MESKRQTKTNKNFFRERLEIYRIDPNIDWIWVLKGKRKTEITDKEKVANKSTKKNNGRRFPWAKLRHMSSNLHTLGDILRECEKADSKNILKLLNSETKEKSYKLPKRGKIQSSTQEIYSKRRTKRWNWRNGFTFTERSNGYSCVFGGLGEGDNTVMIVIVYLMNLEQEKAVKII